jgi:hypothetical protein
MFQRRGGPCGLFSRAEEEEMKLSDDEILLNAPYIRGDGACQATNFTTTFF